MIYFTRGWANGEWSDVRSEEVGNAYEKRLAEILPSLPTALVRLAREISLHDGVIAQVEWRPAEKVLGLSLVCGDLQNGYALVEIIYGGALLGEQRIEALRRAACARDVELLYDEVDIQPDGLLAIGGPLIDAGHTVQLLDAEFGPMFTADIVRSTAGFKPHAVLLGHSGSTSAHPTIVEITQAIRNVMPGIITIYGGVYPTFAWERTGPHSPPTRLSGG
jgi:hypothetical protein